MFKIKHVDKTPTVTADQIEIYHIKLATRRNKLGLQYQTGPRFGQQLASRRKAG